MNIEYQTLEWDSNFFGYKVGQVNLSGFTSSDYDELITALEKESFRLIYIYPSDERSLSDLLALKVQLVDTKVTFSKRIEKNAHRLKREGLESFSGTESYATLLDLAFVSGEYSRFKTDLNFKNGEFEKLYSEWLAKSLSRQIADDIIVYKNESAINGFITYKINQEDQLIIGLIAVDPKAQGMGIGRFLMEAVEGVAEKRMIKEILVSTQEHNKGAMAFYKACGYSIKDKKEILHLWLQ